MTADHEAPASAGASPMSGAELRVIREGLGLSARSLARLLDVTERSVNRWESGGWPVPQGVVDEVECMERAAGEAVGRLVAALRDARDPAVVVYRDDQAYRSAHPGDRYPAEFHRAVVWRALLEIPGADVRWADEVRTR